MLITKIPRRPKRQNKSEYGRRGVVVQGRIASKDGPKTNTTGCITRKAKERPSKAAINTIKYRAKIGFFATQSCCCLLLLKDWCALVPHPKDLRNQWYLRKTVKKSLHFYLTN